MTAIITLREPFKTYFADLEKAHVSFCPSSGRIEFCGFPLQRMPVLDADDAIALAAEMEAALAPVMKRFIDRKLAEVVKMVDATADTLVIR